MSIMMLYQIKIVGLLLNMIIGAGDILVYTVDETSHADINSNYVLEDDPWVTPLTQLILANNMESSAQVDFYSGIALEKDGKD